MEGGRGMSSPPKLSKQTWEQLRDWLLPEEGGVIPDGDLTEQAYRSDERAGLRALLTAEADRGERGDHG